MSSLTLLPIFTTSVVVGEINQFGKTFDNIKISDYVLELEKNTSGRNISNRGGWQSEAYDALDCPNEFLPIMQEIEIHVKDYFNFIGLNKDPENANFWLNVNRKYNYNSVHSHPFSVVSGVLYIKVPKGDSGNIRFYRNDGFSDYVPQGMGNDTPDTFSEFTIVPEPNKLILFPSYIKHSVESNLSEAQDDVRISLAFNYF
jgi:uncharacterized protein (TIGR02466 family)